MLIKPFAYLFYLTTFLFLVVSQVYILAPVFANANELWEYLVILIFNIIYLGLFLLFVKLTNTYKSKIFFLLIVFWLITESLILYTIIDYYVSEPFIWYGGWYPQEAENLANDKNAASKYLFVSIIIQSIKIIVMVKTLLKYFRRKVKSKSNYL